MSAITCSGEEQRTCDNLTRRLVAARALSRPWDPSDAELSASCGAERPRRLRPCGWRTQRGVRPTSCKAASSWGTAWQPASTCRMISERPLLAPQLLFTYTSAVFFCLKGVGSFSRTSTWGHGAHRAGTGRQGNDRKTRLPKHLEKGGLAAKRACGCARPWCAARRPDSVSPVSHCSRSRGPEPECAYTKPHRACCTGCRAAWMCCRP